MINPEKQKNEGRFKVKKITHIDEFKEGMEIPESDLLLKNNEKVVQFEFLKEEVEEKTKYEVKPGVYNIGFKNNSLNLNPLELRSKHLLTSYDNTKKILYEANNFFSNLHKYEEIKAEKRRAVLLYSEPGYGKTSAISKAAQTIREQDDKSVVINWPTSEVDSAMANRFLSTMDYDTHNCSRLVLIIEDIGGGEMEDYGGRERGIDSSLLNLLDGVDNVFPVPTFIIATTNHPGSLLDALADRPGRFDEYIELDPPNADQRIELIEFMANRKCTEDEAKAVRDDAIDFSPAHLSEVIKRSFLKNKTYKQVIDELVDHKSRVSRRFEKRKSTGIGL